MCRKNILSKNMFLQNKKTMYIYHIHNNSLLVITCLGGVRELSALSLVYPLHNCFQYVGWTPCLSTKCPRFFFLISSLLSMSCSWTTAYRRPFVFSSCFLRISHDVGLGWGGTDDRLLLLRHTVITFVLLRHWGGVGR